MKYLSFVLSFFLCFPAYGQKLNSVQNYTAKSFDDFDFENLSTTTKSFIEIYYGLNSLKYKPYLANENAAQGSLTEIAYGRRTKNPAGNYRIAEFEDEYFFSSYFSTPAPKNNTEINFTLWRFGLGLRKGYGYYTGSEISIFPFYQMGLTWNRGDFSEPNIKTFTGQISFFKRFNGNLRFGTINNAGLNIGITNSLTIGGSYETAVIFPRYLVLKQLGSFLIELLSQTGIDYLTKGVIIKASPSITPVAYFLLKNSLSYLFFSLKKEKMNWPFNTEAPLTLETYKFSISIAF